MRTGETESAPSIFLIKELAFIDPVNNLFVRKRCRIISRLTYVILYPLSNREGLN